MNPIQHLLLVLAVLCFSIGLRTFQNRFLHRLGSLGIVVTSFLAGWLLGGSPVVGAVFALSWFFLPWLEILTRVRRMRLPVERTLRHRTPPNRQTFPMFDELSDAVESSGFEYGADTGWDWAEYRQFYRVYVDGTRRAQASICLVEQSDLAFYYVSISSRDRKGNVFVTWNYPFSYGLKIAPRLHLCRADGELDCAVLVERHEAFLLSCGVKVDDLAEPSAETIETEIQGDIRLQIVHNLDCGLLKRDGTEMIRYSVRGMFFLWFQFLRDMVRLS